jgi:uncharacterized protein (DUF1778 family)
VAGGPPGPVSHAAAARAVAWCAYLQGHARRLYASVTDRAQVAAALLAAQLTHGRLASPFTARDVYRNAWTGLTEPRVVQAGQADCVAFLRALTPLPSPSERLNRGSVRVVGYPLPRLIDRDLVFSLQWWA